MKNCNICRDALSEDRINALIFLGTPEDKWCCVMCANAGAVQRVQGIYSGFAGASNLILNKGVGSETGIYRAEDKTEIQDDIAEVESGEENTNRLFDNE